ncbi:CapA family protein [Patescibacteria group bacterium]|nr:CapA family protein [Patescibacteria group bacterium]MBU1730510.1 CapA family protein [Patescibacteria group bacterium]MBU1956482.1 CapA family protein [Patescibacteria group bacterium]
MKLLFIAVIIGVVNMFLQQQTVIVENNNRDSLKMLFLGDVMLGRNVGKYIKEGTDSFFYTKKITKKYNIVSANLEGPITNTLNCQKKAYSFKFNPDIATILADNNIGVVSLANNHSFDCYYKGLDDTRKYLTENQIGYFGGGNSQQSFIIREINNHKIAFIGIDLSIGGIPTRVFYPIIEQLDKENDFVVVNIHWGNEYELNYSTAQQIVGHALIDSGADIIIGHHPHVIQPIEIYKNKPIFYSLGNFIFDQFAEQTTKGVAVEVVLDKKSTATVRILPYQRTGVQPIFFTKNKEEIFCNNFLQHISSRKKCSFGFTY